MNSTITVFPAEESTAIASDQAESFDSSLIIGVGVGVGLCLLIVLSVLLFVCLTRRRRMQGKNAGQDSNRVNGTPTPSHHAVSQYVSLPGSQSDGSAYASIPSLTGNGNGNIYEHGDIST